MKHLDGIREGIRAGRPATGPQTVHIDLTNACNTNCIACWDHSPLLSVSRDKAWKRQLIDPEVVEALLDDLTVLGGLRSIILSGMGEPFIHPEIYRLIASVKSRGLHLTIITNLLLADPKQVLALGVDQLLIGIHSASEGTYRAFHPSFHGDEWRRLHTMLGIFLAQMRHFKHVHVICQVNAHELVEMVRLGHRYEAGPLTFKLASLGGGTDTCRITAAQRESLVQSWVPEATRLASELGVVTNLDLFSRQLTTGGGATAPIAEVGCYMGYVYARVTVDGTVLFCCNTEAVVGSIAEGQRFSDLWQGAAWQALRGRMQRGDFFSGCDRCGKLNQNIKLARGLGRDGAGRLSVKEGS